MSYELRVGDSGYYDVFERGVRLGTAAVPYDQADETFLEDMAAQGLKTFLRSEIDNVDHCDGEIVTSNVFAIDPSMSEAWGDEREEDPATEAF